MNARNGTSCMSSVPLLQREERKDTEELSRNVNCEVLLFPSDLWRQTGFEF